MKVTYLVFSYVFYGAIMIVPVIATIDDYINRGIVDWFGNILTVLCILISVVSFNYLPKIYRFSKLSIKSSNLDVLDEDSELVKYPYKFFKSLVYLNIIFGLGLVFLVFLFLKNNSDIFEYVFYDGDITAFLLMLAYFSVMIYGILKVLFYSKNVKKLN